MDAQRTLSPRAWAELLLLSLLWGGSFLSIRVALDEVPVVTSVAHRVFWASIVLWAIVLWRGLAIPRDPRTWAALFVMGLLNNVIPFSLMAWGQLTITVGLTSILNAATAIFAALVATIVFADERLTIRRATGIALGFAGVVVTIGVQNLTAFDPRSLAQLAVLVGAMSYALAAAWARLRLANLHPLVAAAGMLTASSVIMIPAAWTIDGPIRFDLAPITWAAITYYAIPATALAYLLYYRVLSMAGIANLSLCTLLIPPVSIVLGALVRGEALMPRAYLGLLLLSLGLLILGGWFGKPRR